MSDYPMTDLNILNLSKQAFIEKALSLTIKGKRHIESFYQAFLQKGDGLLGFNPKEPQSFHIFETLQKSIKLLNFRIKAEKDDGFCAKYVLEFEDAHIAELVVIPMKTGLTLCVSSQVGCKMACAFCETGRMGKLRDLSVEEILFQIYFAKFVLKKNIQNIVFMGMGEPFDNYENVTKALDVLIDTKGFNFPASSITVSTSGLVPKIEAFQFYGKKGVKLAVSINGSNNTNRQKVMPVNRLYSMEVLQKSLLEYTQKTNKTILAEYVMLKDHNDSIQNAHELMAYLKQIPSIINLIPYNAQSNSMFEPPEDHIIKDFQKVLIEGGFKTYIRQNKGNPIMAAFGQLWIFYFKKESFKKIYPLIRWRLVVLKDLREFMPDKVFQDEGLIIHIYGKSVLVTDPMRNYAVEKISKAARITHQTIHVNCTLDIQKLEHHVSLLMTFSHFRVKVEAVTDEMYSAIDKACDKLSHVLKKWKGKILHSHHRGLKIEEVEEKVIQAFEADDLSLYNQEMANLEKKEYAVPKIVATKLHPIKTLLPSEAMMKLELSDEPFLVFRNEEDLKIKILYRLVDGNYGLINPQT